MNWLRHEFSLRVAPFRVRGESHGVEGDCFLPRKEPYTSLHELNCNQCAVRHNSCDLSQFMTHSVNSCNTVAIHCVLSLTENTHSLPFNFLRYRSLLFALRKDGRALSRSSSRSEAGLGCPLAQDLWLALLLSWKNTNSALTCLQIAPLPH